MKKVNYLLLVATLFTIFFIPLALANPTLITDANNPVISAGIESNILQDPNNATIIDDWYRSNTQIYYTNTTNSTADNYGTPVLLSVFGSVAYFPYVVWDTATQKYYMFVQIGPGNSNIYLYNSTNKISWSEMNNGNPVLVSGATAATYQIFNPGVDIVNSSYWPMLIEGKANGATVFTESYCYSNLTELNWTKHLSSAAVINPGTGYGAGSAYLKYVPDYNALLWVSGYTTTSYWQIYDGGIFLNTDPTVSTNWIINSTPLITASSIPVADPTLAITNNSGGNTYNIILQYNYNQASLYQAFSNLSLDDFFVQSVSAGTSVPTTYTSGSNTIVVYNKTGIAAYTVPAGVSSLQFLDVAGGGSGGAQYGGGGGAGGVISGNISVYPGEILHISVGPGGVAVLGASITNGNNGGNSIIWNSTYSQTAIGGGYGTGIGAPGNGGPGGSGGGGAVPASGTTTGGSGTSGQGNNGGTGGRLGGGGGGGANGAGGAFSGNYGGSAGLGMFSNITGTNTSYAFGGNGVSWSAPATTTYSAYGAGNGGVLSTVAGGDATSPGSGGGGTGSYGNSGKGADGIVVISYITPSPPVASYTMSNTTGTGTAIVNFTDTSTNSPTSWQWGYKNVTGNNTWVNGPTTEFPTITFGIGNWTTNLTATNAGGSNTFQNLTFVNVTGASLPTPSFTANQTTYTDYPMAVQFTDTSAGGPTAWNYSFGDKYTSTLQNPVHVYTVAGNYTVTMNSSNAYGVGSNVVGYINLTSDVDSNVVSWMHLNTNYTDIQGNSWSGTGNPSISNTYYKFGAGSLGFTANTQYISSPSSNTWNLGTPSQSDEIEFWVYVTGNGGPQLRTLITRQTGTANTNGWGLLSGNADNLYGWYMGSTSNETPTFTISKNIWHHIVGVFSATNITTYEDGSVVSTGIRPAGSYDTPNPLILGNPAGAAPTFYVDEFRMSTNTPRFTAAFSPPYAQYAGNLYAAYANQNPNATLLYKSWPLMDALPVYNSTPHYRTIQIMNVTNATSITTGLSYQTAFVYPGTPIVNATNYADLQLTNVSTDYVNGIVYFTVSRSSGLGMSALFANRTNLVDIPMVYYNYTTQTVINTSWANGTIYNNQPASVTYPVTNYYLTPVPTGTWTIYSNITANATVVGLGSPIQFTDNSLGEPAGWTTYGWAFGDGGTSTMQNPLYTYGSIGNYTVTYTSSLIANASVTNTTTMYINVTTAPPAAPVASFTSSTQIAAVGSAVQFNDTSANTPTAWTWAFGDGSGSSLQNPKHAYSAVGNYTVNLTATNAQGSNTISQTNYMQIKSSLSGFTRQDLTMSPQYVLTLKVVDSSTNLPIPSASVLDSNGGNYTTTTGTFSLTYPYSTIVVYVSATGYTSNSASYVMYASQSQTIQLTKSTTPSTSQTTFYIPQQVRFILMDQNSNYLTGVSMTATPLNFTAPVNWTQTLIGINPSVNLNGTTLSGVTGTDGSWAAPMLASFQYQFQLTGGADNLNYNFTLYPSQTEYTLMIPVGITAIPTSAANVVSYSLSNSSISNTSQYFNMSYTDTSSAGTSSLTFAVYNSTGAVMASQSYTGSAANSEVFSRVVTVTAGQSYTYGLYANQNTYGWINQTQTVTLQNQIALIGAAPGWVEEWLAIGLIIIFAACFSLFSKPFALIIIPTLTWYFQYEVGWLPASFLSNIALGSLLVVAVLLYIRSRENMIQ